MTQYIAIHHSGAETQVWLVERTCARRVDGVHQPEIFGDDPDQILQKLKSSRPDLNFYQLTLNQGEYYPRIARPSSFAPNERPGTNPVGEKDPALVETSQGQLLAFREHLETIFRTVHPVRENFTAYGHEIRNLLILAATEVEAQCRGILVANNAKAFATADYVKLVSAMKLDEYGVRLRFYPWLEVIRPFCNWRESAPTRTLPWYDAYNAVKHNREADFARGTLLHLIEAVCGCAIMMFAQFGRHTSRQEINLFFELIEAPTWQPSDVYSPLYDTSEHRWVFNRPIAFSF